MHRRSRKHSQRCLTNSRPRLHLHPIPRPNLPQHKVQAQASLFAPTQPPAKSTQWRRPSRCITPSVGSNFSSIYRSNSYPGRLALSLPPLEPSYFGHSTPISIDDSDSGRRSARSRRPAAKLRDAEEDEPPSRPVISNVSAIAAVAAREIKEKASPRKRRGGGGAGAKRKRKDVDDGDATYPAKRTRNPRGGSNLLPEDASPSDSMVPLPDVTPTPEPAAEQDDRRPERRTTRSAHGASKRRDSSASSSTASASVGTRGASKVNGTLPAPHVDPPSDAEMRTSGDTKEAKEEGEVSEEAP